ncbi:hypothetical protein DTL21_11845 [Bremerella cremea]|uniref:Uncharacterized protein n=1 Tax=Blastopirellula marina TaxID=124 RepID=A0A2S8FPX7_9BACT|nr:MULTISPECIES: hypothetical protein [Pirellulaceae]PQO34221.1 hypothetical protein C5Y83_11840 [Blastopirellula marina]RCS46717.1 hypothetical protein DTL21_11845 [Bremerella cremea]
MLRLLLALVIASTAFMLSDIIAVLVSENCVELTGLTRDTLFGTTFLALTCFPMFVSARLAGCEFSIPFAMELAVVGCISGVVTSMFDDYWGVLMTMAIVLAYVWIRNSLLSYFSIEPKW